eukprot:CAMPEP_0114232050 /NCGR_PEP_ID=MMETSP0058-20121206/4391_1 /TAXON_ID=36894 /ORGANISM="Pyramimonas parkeae, CCMP726" /LENGTH=263 /DNA_ID=CAMNT_0001343481 /DNA_START=110 /DNA_END=901 /DNA_ORIENTATION=+
MKVPGFLKVKISFAWTLVAATLSSTAGERVSIYFGSGCFWGRQKDFADVEKQVLGRSSAEVTSLVGYAGGHPEAVKRRACYYHAPHDLIYENQGHAEVTQVDLMGETVEDLERQMASFSEKFFTQFVRTARGMQRTDPQDRGPGYRTLVGIPGGMSPSASEGDMFKVFASKNVNHMDLVEGEGSEDDVVNTVFVMDSNKFPFYPAEMFHQFHDGLGHRFPEDYTQELRATQVRLGRVKPTGCPEHGVDPHKHLVVHTLEVDDL